MIGEKDHGGVFYWDEVVTNEVATVLKESETS